MTRQRVSLTVWSADQDDIDRVRFELSHLARTMLEQRRPGMRIQFAYDANPEPEPEWDDEAGFDYQRPCSGSCSCRGRPPEESRPTTIYREYGETTPVPSGYCEVTALGASRRCFISTGMPNVHSTGR